MRVILNIHDRVWADFVSYLREAHQACVCQADPSEYINHQLKQHMIEVRLKKLLQERQASGHRPLDSVTEFINPADQRKVAEWEAEYDEEP